MDTLETTPDTEAITFCIKDARSADWLLQKLAAIEAEIALLKEQAEQAITRLEADRASLTKLYGAQLEEWTRMQIAQDPRGRRSVILPHGTCCLRTVPSGTRIANEGAALKAAQEMGTAYYRVSLSPEYKKHAEAVFKSGGELLPGIEHVPTRESFYIKFGK